MSETVYDITGKKRKGKRDPYLSIEDQAREEGYEEQDIEYSWIWTNFDSREMKCFHCFETGYLDDWLGFLSEHKNCKKNERFSEPPELF